MQSQTSSGGVTINGLFSHYLEDEPPPGGINQSSIGRYHGVRGFLTFARARAQTWRPGFATTRAAPETAR